MSTNRLILRLIERFIKMLALLQLLFQYHLQVACQKGNIMQQVGYAHFNLSFDLLSKVK